MTQFVVLMLVLSLNGAMCNNPSPVCKQLNDVVNSLCSPGESSISSNSTRGPPGKRGPKGLKGDVGGVGPEGPPGVVDYERVGSEVEDKLDVVNNQNNQKLSLLNARIDELEILLERSEQKIHALEEREGICDVKYEGKCFWAVSFDYELSYENTLQWCAKRSGSPANIYSEEHYTIIMRYLRSKILSGKDVIYLWIGMRTDPATAVVTFSDGRPAPFMKWYPGTPSKNPAYTHMTIVQRAPTSQSHVGIHNYPPAATRIGGLCEK